MKTSVSVLAVLGCIFLTGCEEEQTYPDLETGKELYQFHCMKCHGESGAGMFLKGITPEVLIRSHIENTKKKVTEGKGGMMPVFKGMPIEHVTKIANYLRNDLGKK